MREALYYEKQDKGKVRCLLCPHNCVILPGKKGICRVRINDGGKLYSLVYGKPVAVHIDPIEKKPLFHFYPGSEVYSLATVGCNLRCMHCQNWSISQAEPESSSYREVSPDHIVNDAFSRGCKIIAYTYTEPTIFYEYAYDIAVCARQRDIKNVFVTNGFISPEPLRDIAPYIDAVNIDLKSMREGFYQRVCGGHLKPVLDSIKLYYELGVWVEITTLIIPGYNDSPEELEDIARFIAGIDKNIPWHISRFYPNYKLEDISPTSTSIINRAVKIGKKVGLSYIYQGNVGTGENTFCPSCGQILILRTLFFVGENRVKDGRCPYCGERIAGVGLG